MMQKMRITLLITALVVLASTAFSLDVPALRGRVNDYAGMLSPATVQDLEQKLAALEQSDSTQIVVLTIPTLGGDALEDFSIRVAEAWRVGQKGVDNGIIFLIARQERKIRIEVGRGLEGKLTDLVSGPGRAPIRSTRWSFFCWLPPSSSAQSPGIWAGLLPASACRLLPGMPFRGLPWLCSPRWGSPVSSWACC